MAITRSSSSSRQAWASSSRAGDKSSRLLARGAESARAVSGPKLQEVKRRMGLVLPLAYLTAPVIKGGTGRLPWYDGLAALLGFATSIYVYIDYPRLANEIAYQPWEALTAAVILLLLIVEGVRRTAGLTKLSG